MIGATYLKAFVGGYLANRGPHKASAKLVIFESDDWGAVRTPNKAFVEQGHQQGLEIANSRFKVDALASERDLDDLFDLLTQFRDGRGQPAIFTANSIMANPAFDQIAATDYQQYVYEPFYRTFARYPAHQNNLVKWKEGMRAGVFQPQFHGREHLHYRRWLKDLRAGDGRVQFSFAAGSTYSGRGDYSYMGAFDWDEPGEVENHRIAVREGLDIFADTFGFRSTAFIAPCYTWDQTLDETLYDCGVKIIQGLPVQLQPREQGDYLKIKHHFWERNAHGMHYNIRNCAFEPVAAPDQDWVDKVMARMQVAFLLGKPAVISTHRVNYIGFIEEANKTNGLRELSRLLKTMLRKWPDLQFISTDQLIEYI